MLLVQRLLFFILAVHVTGGRKDLRRKETHHLFLKPCVDSYLNQVPTDLYVVLNAK